MSKSDWEFFNCSEPHEHDYVVGLYPKAEKEEVRNLLKKWCKDGTINNTKHTEIYELLEKKGYHRN